MYLIVVESSGLNVVKRKCIESCFFGLGATQHNDICYEYRMVFKS